MRVPFTKYNGAGNDFILIDNRELGLKLTPEQAIRLCHRHCGIGADGILLLKPCASGAADFAWDFHQCDGDTANMCGNGARCFTRFVHETLGHTNPITFETGAGVVAAKAVNGEVSIRLPNPQDLRLHVALDPPSFGHSIAHFVNTGVPHAVVLVDSVDDVDILAQGKELRHHAAFGPRGTNVNFIQVVGKNHLRARSYERGVEGETLACGTGVAAAALITSKLYNFTSPVVIDVQSGAKLTISFDVDGENFSNVWLAGPAERTFTGEVDI